MAASKMTVLQVVSKRDELQDRDSTRNESYDEVLKFYGGDTYRNIKKQGFVGGIAQALSSIFTPKAQDEGAELKTPINLVKPAIENKVAFLALPPTVRVIEPPDELAPVPQLTAGTAPPSGGMAGPAQVGAMAAGETQPTGIEPVQAPSTPPPTGQIPTPPPGSPMSVGPTNDDWATDFADRLERVIHSLLAQSNMPQRCRDVAWSMSAMDGAVIGVWPDMRHKRPRIFTRTPQDFFPESYDPDGLDLKLALWTEEITGSEVATRYGDAIGKKYAGRTDVDIIQCIDESAFYTVLDKKEWAHPPMDNMTGVVPIVCVGSLGLPGMIFGSNDFKDAIPVAKEINYHMYLIDEVAASLVRPTIAVKDPINVPENIAIGTGGTITMGPNGSVELLGPLPLPNAFWQLGAQLENWFNLISDNPDVLRSSDAGGLTTGAGFNAKLGPIAARQQTKLEILMSAWRQVIKYMLIMWANFPGMKEVTASGVQMKESFYIRATPQDFMIDGEIWTEMDVFLSAQSFIDRQGNAVEIMQLYQNELMDWDTAVDNLQQITDKRRTRSRIDKDRQWKAEGMATAQAAAQSVMTANTPISDQQKTNYGLERGFIGETGEMPGPQAKMAEAPPEMGAPAPEASAMQAGDTAEEIVSVLREFFSGIGKLRGAVWFGGDPVLQPAKIAQSDSWKVDVWLTDPQDQGTITRAAENVEVIYGHLRFHRGQPSPEEQAIQVSQGGPVEEPEPEEPAAPAAGGELPPELQALIGGENA